MKPSSGLVTHAGSPRKSVPFVNNTSPTSVRTFNCASYSFFGSADSRNDHSIESPHSADAGWAAKNAGIKDTQDKSEAGSESAPEGSAHASDHAPTFKGSETAGDEAGVSTSSQGQVTADEDHGVPTDEEILMSYLNLGPGF